MLEGSDWGPSSATSPVRSNPTSASTVGDDDTLEGYEPKFNKKGEVTDTSEPITQKFYPPPQQQGTGNSMDLTNAPGDLSNIDVKEGNNKKDLSKGRAYTADLVNTREGEGLGMSIEVRIIRESFWSCLVDGFGVSQNTYAPPPPPPTPLTLSPPSLETSRRFRCSSPSSPWFHILPRRCPPG